MSEDRGERMSSQFHQLTVARVDPLTDDSAAVTFAVPDQLKAVFAFRPGQSLTIRKDEQRRSYSICAPLGCPPRIGVREVAGGAVSGWLVHDIRVGDVVDVQPPSGAFTPDLSAPGEHVLIAAGSGITPMLSIATSVLAASAQSTVTLLYGNRRSSSVMFADDVADVKDLHPDRMQIIHVLSREAQEVELFSGRLDAQRLRALLPVTVDVGRVAHWWLCGPFGMVLDATDVLTGMGVPRTRIHRELFYVEQAPPEQVQHVDTPVGVGSDVTVILDGRTSVARVPAGVPILDGAQPTRPELPFACKGGVCGTCRARVTGGEVFMRRNFALEDDEVAAGYVLTCQSVPVTESVTVDYDD